MTLLIAVLAAIITTILWYTKDSNNTMKLGNLSLMFWGASLMWFVDAIFEYVELEDAYFYPSLQDALNDTFLGVSVVAFALLIWVVYLLIKNPLKVGKKEESNNT